MGSRPLCHCPCRVRGVGFLKKLILRGGSQFERLKSWMCKMISELPQLIKCTELRQTVNLLLPKLQRPFLDCSRDVGFALSQLILDVSLGGWASGKVGETGLGEFDEEAFDKIESREDSSTSESAFFWRSRRSTIGL